MAKRLQSKIARVSLLKIGIVVAVLVVAGFCAIFVWSLLVTDTTEKRELDHIDIEVRYIKTGCTYVFNITAYDTVLNPLEGVEIHLIGCGVDETKITAKDGKAQFSITPLLPQNVNFDEIQVTAKYMGAHPKILKGVIFVYD
ncbi:MAG: hypothetical protein QW620_05395 [Thermoplasmata archaeon]